MTAILLISCPDQRGITAAITQFIAQNNGNIEHADQHIDHQKNIFFSRFEWSLDKFSIPKNKIASEFKKIAETFHMTWNLYFSDEPLRVALFVSKPLHCLMDILLRHKGGQFPCEIPLILSNHSDAKEIAESFKIPYHSFPMFPHNKLEEEKKQLQLLHEHKIDLIILARYHQILSPSFVDEFKNKIINIHHSFLPAFSGKSPYSQAFQKGVKIIGATSHYVTSILDEGPIIDQDTVRISHRDSLKDLITKGEDLEKVVLSRAVRWHLSHKILSYGNKTVIFD